MTAVGEAPVAGVAAAVSIRCVFALVRGSDVLFRRTVDLPAVPRVDDRIHIWVPGADIVRGRVRSVRWAIDEAATLVVHVQVELSPADRKRFAQRPAVTDPE